MKKRDLTADLALCDAATDGPWGEFYDDVLRIGTGSCNTVSETVVDESGVVRYPDASFIAEARTGWPIAIERAIRAEAEVERLQGNCQALYDTLIQALEYVPGGWTEECRQIIDRIRADIYEGEVTA
ncbi:hypothetical protein [Brevibacillus daliensis]|uniref:hypothetical protein n=1 Tax=Brevibacillus daliensis TaxID=2892995 RepID=UPI001E5A7CE6|nr:hypothetical protein [Brevibacillus daliensis]